MVRKILMTAMVALLLITAGCDEQKDPPIQPDSQKQQTTEEPEPEKEPLPENKTAQPNVSEKKNVERQKKTLQVKVYYPDDAGINLVGVTRQIKITKDEDKYFNTALLLTETPKEKDLTKIFPSHAKINGVLLKRDTAFVNFDSSITKYFVGGSTGEEMLINSFVQTLTEFPEVKQVKFLIDGKDIETLSGHMDLSAPLKRSEE